MPRWIRRGITIPLYGALLLASAIALPLALPVAWASDLARGSRGGAARAVLFLVFYLACEVAGIAASFALWLAGLASPRARQRAPDRHFRLQCWWAKRLLFGAARLFDMRFQVEGDGDLGPGPILLLSRHASVGDTLIPAVFVSDRHDVKLRYVLKRELLWDPCLDIVGNRLPNVFVQRGSGQTAREIAAVARLAQGVGPGEGVLIYPEGTRFTEARRARILSKPDARPEVAAAARRLQHVLPPKLGGPLALLDAAPGADVVFCEHVGFDAVTHLSDLLGGALVRATVRVRFRRVPRAQVPDGREARGAWLLAEWTRIDAWIAEQKRRAARDPEAQRRR